MKIGFNKPYFCGLETEYIKQAVQAQKISGDGEFTKKCHAFFEEEYGFRKTLLTTSCTDALEMAAILLNIQPGDEVIMPSYTFVSTANAFVLRGARIVFADSTHENPNMDATNVESLITANTKAIVPVHYAGIACEMGTLKEISSKYDIAIIEDAAQAIDSFHNEQPLGSLGSMSAFSFHETKNIISGEGGMLVINDPKLVNRAEIIREKGTNRSAFFRGEVDKYNWVDVGSSFLPSDIIAAFLYAQLENLDNIQTRRKQIWNQYYQGLKLLEDQGLARLPSVPPFATNNAHMFYLVCPNSQERDRLIYFLKEKGVQAIFHYLSLHKSPFYESKHDGRVLFWADYYTNGLLRLPLYYELTDDQVQYIVEQVLSYYAKYPVALNN